jgi:methyl-accepting chemotaxis protein
LDIGINLTVGRRLAIAFGISVALLVAILTMGTLQARALHTSQQAYSGQIFPGIRAIHSVLHSIDDARRWETQHLTLTGWAEMAEMESKIQQDRTAVAENLQAYGPLISDDEDRNAYEQIQSLATDYWRVQDKVLELSHNKSNPSDSAAAAKLEQGEALKAYYGLKDAAAVWETHKQELGTAIAAASEQRHRRDLIKLFALGIFALQHAVFSGLLIARSIAKPLNQAIDMAKAVARGDLSKRVTSTAKDDMGTLVRALSDMTQQLSELITDVAGSARAVSVTAHEIAQSNEELSQRTQEQAASLEETAASMEEITSIGKNNTTNAGNADTLARDAQNLAESGGTVVSQAVAAMSAINDCSQKISSIISVIDEIAFQTNLLALNAAVEAARAGDQGRGFGVVASEVRALAQRSADAAKQIKALISDSAEKVRTGTELVDRSGRSLSEILSSVRKMAGLISEIANWSHEQSEGVIRVNEAILKLDGATQQNAALVEEGAAASRTLQDQANALNRRAAFFKVEPASPQRRSAQIRESALESAQTPMRTAPEETQAFARKAG